MKNELRMEAEKLFLNELTKKLNNAKKSYEIARNDTIEAEGRMVTRYDSTKTETAWLADGYLTMVNELKISVERLKIDNNLKVNVGDIITTSFLDNDIYTKKVVKVGGFEKNGDYEYIDVSNPLATALFGALLGESVQIVGNKSNIKYDISNIKKANREKDFVASLYDLILIKDEFGDQLYFYITDLEAGIFSNLSSGDEINIISKKTPAAGGILGHRVGETVKFGQVSGKIFEIIKH